MSLLMSIYFLILISYTFFFLIDDALNFEHMFDHLFYSKVLFKCIKYK